MTQAPPTKPRIAIACGGTGGHFFPGVAVAHSLERQGCEVVLFVSNKLVDQEALKTVPAMRSVSLPAVGFSCSQVFSSILGLARSYRQAANEFAKNPCQAVLAMGGFTSAPPVLAGKASGASIFLHESNAIPGKATRWLARVAHHCFVGFPQCASHLPKAKTKVTGTPVRPQFIPGDASTARTALGLSPEDPAILVMGGSQGASALNTIAPATAAVLRRAHPHIQVLHLAGTAEADKVEAAYRASGVRALVKPFMADMNLALQACSAAVARAGASTLAELAATQLPAVLIPYPLAAGNHQFFNASAFSDTGAARLLPQTEATAERLAVDLEPLIFEDDVRTRIRAALAKWHQPNSAELISTLILNAMRLAPVAPGVEAAPGAPRFGATSCISV